MNILNIFLQKRRDHVNLTWLTRNGVIEIFGGCSTAITMAERFFSKNTGDRITKKGHVKDKKFEELLIYLA